MHHSVRYNTLFRDRRHAGPSAAALIQCSIIMGARCPGRARCPYSGDDGPGKEDRWLVVALPAAAERWRRLVRSLFRIRRLQRIFGNLGQFLQLVASKELREELKRLL